MIKMGRDNILVAAKTLKELGFKEINATDDLERDKEKMARRTYMVVEDSTEGAGWSQDFLILITKGRDGKIIECGWFEKKMAVM